MAPKLVLFVSCLAFCRGDFDLAIIHTNDVHSRVEQTDVSSAECSEKDAADDKCYGGMARMWTKIQELRAQYPDNSLLVDAGDQFQGSLWSTYYKGREAAFFMNEMKYDIMTLGNHDFDYGVETVGEFIHNLTFPVVVSNMDADQTVLKDAYLRSYIFTINQKKIGVVAYLTEQLPLMQNNANIKGLTVKNEIEEVRREAANLKTQGVDIILALGHSGYDLDRKLAAEVDDIDVVIGGHSHTFLYTGEPPSDEEPLGEYPTVIQKPSGGKALVITEFAFSKYLGFLKVTFTDQGEVKSWEGQPILLSPNIAQDAAMSAKVALWAEPLKAITQTVIGETKVFLEGDNIGDAQVCRRRECSLGNVITDAVLWSFVEGRKAGVAQWSDVSMAVWNGGGIRIDLEEGPITLGDVLVTLPFKNTIEMVVVTGAILRQMMENSVSKLEPYPSGRFLQMSGIKVTYNVKKPVGERVVSVKVKCTQCRVPTFRPLENDQTYKLLVNTYIANGKSGFSMVPQEGRINIGTLVSDALIDYIEKFSPIVTGLEGRIEFVTEDAQAPDVSCNTVKPIPAIELLCIYWCRFIYKCSFG